MTITSEALTTARAKLATRIDTLGRELSHMSISRVAYAVDDIRRDARDSHFDTVATLASNLERALASSGGTMVVMPYLEAMGDALDDNAMQPHVAAALLASVGVRLHG